MGDQGFLEKRQHERITAHFRVRYRVIDGAEADALVSGTKYKDITTGPVIVPMGGIKDVMTVVSENISVGGLMLTGPNPFKEGTSLSVELDLAGVPIPVKAISVVVRAPQKPNARGVYEAGVQFLAISKEDVAKVENFIVQKSRTGNF